MSYNPENPIPAQEFILKRNIRKLRILEAKMEFSKKGNPMWVFSTEITGAQPQTDVIAGEQYVTDINGLQLTAWYTLSSQEKPKANPFMLSQTNKLLRSFGMPEVKSAEEAQGINPELFIGKIITADCEGKKVTQKDGDGKDMYLPDTTIPFQKIQTNVREFVFPPGV